MARGGGKLWFGAGTSRGAHQRLIGDSHTEFSDGMPTVVHSWFPQSDLGTPLAAADAPS